VRPDRLLKAAERARKARRMVIPSQLCFLEAAGVTPATELSYRSRVQEFVTWAAASHRDWKIWR